MTPTREKRPAEIPPMVVVYLGRASSEGRVTPGLHQSVVTLAEDLGRARRLVDPDSNLGYLLERAAGRVETLDAALRPTAADRVREGCPVAEALATVDRERRDLHRRLGRAAA